MIFMRQFFRTSRGCPRKFSFDLASKVTFLGEVFICSFSTVKHMKVKMTGEKADSVKCVNGIIKSPEDKRCYRGLELGNKMKILLISDENTDKSAAAINVAVGYFSDPMEAQGLAHFCEHMLFLGTEKYPAENDYADYIVKHGGSYNASTSSEYTNYFFDIIPKHFEGALDRFAQFFLSPLFTESATEREINAVNSEFEKNIPIDAWRLHYLEKHISKEGHAFRKFGIGNFKTLGSEPKEKGINIRDELLKFHKKWYSANIMTLAVLGKESLDDLEKMVTSLFLNVENKNVERPEWTEHPFDAEHLQLEGYIVPVKNLRNIIITFPVPDFHKYYKSAPLHYVSHLVGHEGPGSLLSELKARGWCNYLESGYMAEAKGFGFFTIKTDLTEDGFEHTDEIVTLVFQYLNMLKKEGPKEWIFRELQTIHKTSFQFKEKESPAAYVRSLAKHLHDYSIEEVLCGPYFLEEWRPDLIELGLSYLQPKFVRVAVIGKKLESVANETEPWFGTKYKFEKIPSATLEKWENAGFCDALQLPKPNAFITSNYDIFPRDEQPSLPHPEIIHTSPITRVWFKQDDEFFLPKAHLKFEFVCPLAYFDPLYCGMTYLYVQLLKDSLNEYDYDAKLAGLSWNIVNTDYGMQLIIGGYNDKQGVLLDKVLERMMSLEIDPKRFEYIKELYVRTLKNFEAEQPYQQVMFYLSLLTSEQAWTKNELLKNAEYITLEGLREFIPQLLIKLHVECLIHGNINREGAHKVIDIVEKRLNNNASVLPILPSQLLKRREIQLEDGDKFAFTMSNVFFSSSCTETYYQCTRHSTQNNMMMELLVQIIHDPCFNILRTQEQLGYVVSSGLKRSHCAQGLRIIVQSDRHPLYIDQRIEAFLIQFRDLLEKMSDEDFERHRESLADVKLEKPKKLSALSSKFWMEIQSQHYHFNRDEVEVAYLRTITKEQLLEFFDNFIRYNAPHRRKLSVYVLAEADGGAGKEPEPDAETLSSSVNGLPSPPPYTPAVVINDVTKFKSSRGLYPLVQPYMDIDGTMTKSKL